MNTKIFTGFSKLRAHLLDLSSSYVSQPIISAIRFQGKQTYPCTLDVKVLWNTIFLYFSNLVLQNNRGLFAQFCLKRIKFTQFKQIVPSSPVFSREDGIFEITAFFGSRINGRPAKVRYFYVV